MTLVLIYRSNETPKDIKCILEMFESTVLFQWNGISTTIGQQALHEDVRVVVTYWIKAPTTDEDVVEPCVWMPTDPQ